MTGSGGGSTPTEELCRRLSARHAEIEQAVLTHVRAVSNPADTERGAYAAELRSAVSAGVSHGLAGVQLGEDRAGPLPPTLLSQARRAARRGIALDVLLRRYFASYTLFSDFVIQAATESDSPLRGGELRRVLLTQAVLLERAVLAVLGEYTRESVNRHDQPEQRRVERVKRLLAGEAVEIDELGYEFSDWHVGAVVRGAAATPMLRELAEVGDRRLLMVRPEKGLVWAWFGGRRKIEMAEIVERVEPEELGEIRVALGEPARGLEGWRLTHQQASAVSRIGGGDSEQVVRYADVGLLASISRDRVLASSLHQLFLAPLSEGRSDGAELRKTLRAYFSTGRNISSAASALRVSRQTVGNRLRIIEEKLGRTLESCAPEIEVALRLEDNEEPAA